MNGFETRTEPYEDILFEKKNGIATVTINRPKAMNAYTTGTLREMADAFRDVAWDDSIGLLILTGAGDRAFCTGGDVKEYATRYVERPRDYWKYMGIFAECHDLLRDIGKPTIARLNGTVAGGGNEFNMACDLAIAADDVKIQQVGTRVGSVAAGGATQWLPIMVGDRRAREILFLCQPIPATQAMEWGLVNRVVPRAELDNAVAEMAEILLDKAPECMRYTKAQVNYWKDQAWDQTIGHARDWLSLHFANAEPYEGMKAFVEKRKPDWRGYRDKAARGEPTESVWGSPTRECPGCGTKGLPETFTFCGVCGKRIEAES